MLDNLFLELDIKLQLLGDSDSSVEFAPHIRDEFDSVIEALNTIKEVLKLETKSSDWYFE